MKTQKASAPLPLRLEPGLRAWLEGAARANKRSMNGEVTVLLERQRAQTQKELQHG
jgi:hypothetical protein